MGMLRPPAPCTCSCFWGSPEGREVHVVSVDPDAAKANALAERGAALFRSHGYAALSNGVASRGKVSDSVLGAISTCNAGRLVMGGLRPRRRHPPHVRWLNNQAPADSQPRPSPSCIIRTSTFDPIQIKSGEMRAISVLKRWAAPYRVHNALGPRFWLSPEIQRPRLKTFIRNRVACRPQA